MRLFAIAAIAVALVVAAVFVTAPPQRIPRDDVYGHDGPSSKAAILKVVPLGSTADQAKSTMEAKGFRCGMTYDKPHSGFDPSNPQRQMTYPPADFLSCESGKRWAGWRSLVLDKEWRTAFVIKNQAVTSVDVYVVLTGP